MIFDEPYAEAMMRIVLYLAGGRPGVHVRRGEVAHHSTVDPAVVAGVLDSLVAAGMLRLGATDDRICASPSAIAWMRSHPPQSQPAGTS